MCGRFSLAVTPDELAKFFDLDEVPDFPARYNIAPSQPIAVILKTSDQPERHFRLMRWGLIPAWAKDPAIGNRLINARAETVAEKPSFRAAFKRRRCLIPASGFFEWQKTKAGKQPFYFRPQDEGLFAIAGLWESWQEIETCTILTTAANELLQPIHERMPVILNPADYDQWLDWQTQDTEALQALLKPFLADQMLAYPVSKRVNNATIDNPECIAKADLS
jgi:putative SOS response-associated peptidase YedK